MNFIYFKTVTGVTLVLVLIIAFINILSTENASMQIKDMRLKNSKLFKT
jgi:hypothetical protein